MYSIIEKCPFQEKNGLSVPLFVHAVSIKTIPECLYQDDHFYANQINIVTVEFKNKDIFTIMNETAINNKSHEVNVSNCSYRQPYGLQQ